MALKDTKEFMSEHPLEVGITAVGLALLALGGVAGARRFVNDLDQEKSELTGEAPNSSDPSGNS